MTGNASAGIPPAMRGHEERSAAPTEWHKEPIALVSSQLMRRADRAEELLRAEDWDLIVLDEPAWTDTAFLTFHDRLSKTMPSHDDVEELARMFRSMEQQYGEYSRDEIAG